MNKSRKPGSKVRSFLSETVGDLVSDVISTVVLYVLGAIAVVGGVALYFDLSFFAAFGLCAVLIVGFFAVQAFQDIF